MVARNVGIFCLLPEPQQQRLLATSRVIAAERHWVGCRGLEVTDEMKATVSAQAALLVLGVEGYYFDKLPAILLYPGSFMRPHAAGETMVDEEAGALGESWQGGNIVLSWHASLEGGRNPRDGQNVVLHEFAHHLDSLDGEAGGHPPQPSREAADKWERVLKLEYGKLLRALSNGERTLLDPYAAESKAEFFAVATEVFFERPVELAKRHAALFEILRDFYKLDPVRWFPARREADGSVPQAERRHRDRSCRAGRGRRRPGELPRLERAEDYFLRGWDSFRADRYDEAEADFTEVLRRKPHDAEALEHRAECRLALGQPQQALADAAEACRLAPDEIEPIRIRGMCLAEVGKYEEALADLDLALRQHADDSDALFGRGTALAGLARWSEAARDFTAALAADPHDAEAWLWRSQCHVELGDEIAAANDRQRALELDPTLAKEEAAPEGG